MCVSEHFGNIPRGEPDRVHKLITEDIPSRVAADQAEPLASLSDKQNAHPSRQRALARVRPKVLKDDTGFSREFMDNEGFRRWLTETVLG
jgi:type I restriction enzyme R subunit